jgi:hypothetical protein
MGVDIVPFPSVRMKDLFDGRLEKFGVHELKIKETSSKSRCLTDGQNYAFAHSSRKVFVAEFTFVGEPDRIFQAIIDEFGIEIVRDDDPRLWNPELSEEEEAKLKEESEKLEQKRRQQEKKALKQLIRYLKGETYNIGLVSFEEVPIAKRLIAQVPELLEEDKQEFLRWAIGFYSSSQNQIDSETSIARILSEHEKDPKLENVIPF